MHAEDEAKLLRRLANIDTALAARNINAAAQIDLILTHLSRINSTLSAIDSNLALLEKKG